MAIGDGCKTQLRRANSETAVGGGLGFGNCTRMIGRKRVAISHCLDASSFSSPPTSPHRKRADRKERSETSQLEALPEDILVRILTMLLDDFVFCFLHFLIMIPPRILMFSLVQIRILCFVDHDDLKQLFHVSKSIKETVSSAEHFEIGLFHFFFCWIFFYIVRF